MLSYRIQNPPNLLEIYQSAVAFEKQQQSEKALPLWQRLNQLQPRNADILASLGRVLIQMNQLQDANEYLQQALSIDPKHLNALLNRAVALHALGSYVEALDFYQQILPLDLHSAKTALFNMGTIYQHQLDFESAHAAYSKLLMLEPSHVGAHVCLLFSQHYLMPPRQAEIAARARHFGSQFAALYQPLPPQSVDVNQRRPLRIGLVSADLRDHPVGYFLEGLLNTKTADAIEWIAYSNTRFETALTERIRPLLTEWHAVWSLTDDVLATQIRQDNIDVLIDLSGFTSGHRMGVFAQRPAPVQITWLGYFGTTGMPFMDAVIADPYCVPDVEEDWFTEKVYRLPHTRFCLTPPTDAPPVMPLPALKNGYITFGCFQDIAKINDSVLTVWASIAKGVPTARFRLQRKSLERESDDQQKLQARMERVGMDVSRVDWYGEVQRVEYLSAYAEVDVVLDTFPYPGGTTTAEALWMGVPTISLVTEGMLGRQGQQLLTAAGLPEWVCHDEQSYLNKALDIAQPAVWNTLARQRDNLRAQVSTTPLFDHERFAVDWYQVVQTIWQDKCEQLTLNQEASTCR